MMKPRGHGYPEVFDETHRIPSPASFLVPAKQDGKGGPSKPGKRSSSRLQGWIPRGSFEPTVRDRHDEEFLLSGPALPGLLKAETVPWRCGASIT